MEARELERADVRARLRRQMLTGDSAVSGSLLRTALSALRSAAMRLPVWIWMSFKSAICVRPMLISTERERRSIEQHDLWTC
jgi:hypothetical protein